MRHHKDPKTTAEKLRAERDQLKKSAKIALENVEDYRMAVNGMAATPNGELFFKTLIKACGVFDPKHSTDALALIEDNAKRNVYLEFIRPFLEPEIRKELEG